MIQGRGRTRATKRAGVDTVTYLIPITRGRNTREFRFEGLSYKCDMTKEGLVPYIALTRLEQSNWLHCSYNNNNPYANRVLEVDCSTDPRTFLVYAVPVSAAVAQMYATSCVDETALGTCYVGMAGVLSSYRHHRGWTLRRGWACDIVLSTRVTESLRARKSVVVNPWMVRIGVEQRHETGEIYTVCSGDTMRAEAMHHLDGAGLRGARWTYDDEAYAAMWAELVRGACWRHSPETGRLT